MWFNPQNYTVTEGDEVSITLVTSSSAYMFDFILTVQSMNGSAVGELVTAETNKNVPEIAQWVMYAYMQLTVMMVVYSSHFSASSLTAGNDYMAGPYTVSFSSGLMYATLMVPTVDDNTTELSEYFRVVIATTSQPGVTGIGSPNMAFITIEDNDPGNSNISANCSIDACPTLLTLINSLYFILFH